MRLLTRIQGRCGGTKVKSLCDQIMVLRLDCGMHLRMWRDAERLPIERQFLLYRRRSSSQPRVYDRVSAAIQSCVSLSVNSIRHFGFGIVSAW